MSDWREAEGPDITNMLRDLTPAQAEALTNLMGRMAGARVRLRTVREFDGQVDAPVALEVPGTRFLIAVDGEISEYPWETE